MVRYSVPAQAVRQEAFHVTSGRVSLSAFLFYLGLQLADESHPHERGQSALLSLPSQMLISSKKPSQTQNNV